ncbi:MAG: Do family serine endopeptidase [Cyclobacteriaceae bacterium]|nr:Do family serine endopeptidase [Cyclobacteriaceae bacterium HetDA_MAG_MS6]
MNKKSLFFAMVFSSFLGGVIAIGGYTLVFPSQEVVPVSPVAQTGQVSFTNYVFDTADFVVPDGLNFVYAAKSATPSVVHIRTTYEGQRNTTAQRSPFDDFFKDYFQDRDRRQYRSPSRGAGSGVIVSDQGYIVTNNHVVDGASEIEVLLNDNRTYQAEVVGVDPTTDLAVIRIQADDIKPMKWGDSENVHIGEWVLAVGNPFEFRSTVTAGIVSAKARNINILANSNNNGLQIESFIQTDAAVNPGNSGGALVNLKGELVGVNTAIASPTGAFAGYSFAVPVTLVKKVAEDLIEFGAVQRALLGIRIEDVSSALAERENLDVLRGIYVRLVNPESAALEAGMKEGDVIVAIDGKKVNSVSELQEQVALNRPGDKVSVTYIRDGKTRNTEAVLKNSYNTTEVVKIKNEFTTEGATFKEVTTEEREELGIEGGVKVDDVENGKWKEAGIKDGFIITRIDKNDIQSLDDFTSYLRLPRGEGMLIEGMYPNGDKAYYGIGW